MVFSSEIASSKDVVSLELLRCEYFVPGYDSDIAEDRTKRRREGISPSDTTQPLDLDF